MCVAMRSRNQRSWLITTAQPAKLSSASSSARSVSTSRSLVGSSSRSRLLRPGDHPEQGRLSGAVRPDDADNAAARQREVEILDQQVVAVALAQVAGFNDDVAEPRPWRDVDFCRLDPLRRVLLQQVFVRVQPRLALRLARPRRHPDPFELALERPLPPRLRLLLLRQPALLLLEP